MKEGIKERQQDTWEKGVFAIQQIRRVCLSAKVTQSDASKYQPRLSVVDLRQVQLSQHKEDKRKTEPCAIISPQS